MNAIRTIFLLALSGLLAACASGPRVMADSDPNADFSHYRTYAFSDRIGTNRDDADTLLTQRLKAATAREMQARGYVYRPQSPDLLLNFHAKVEEKYRSSPMIAPIIGYYAYRGGFYATWPSWNYDTYADRYTEGTLNIDLIDAARKRLVWETVVLGNAARATGPRAAGIVDAAVTAAFRRFPIPLPAALPADH